MCVGSACSPALPGKSPSAAAMAHTVWGGLAGCCNHAATNGAAVTLSGVPPGPAAVLGSHSPDCKRVLQKVNKYSRHAVEIHVPAHELLHGLLIWPGEYAYD